MRMINCDFGDGKIVQFDVSKLTPDHSVSENEHERTEIIQYRFMGKVVHRSAHVRLKHGIGIEAMLGRMG